MSSQRDGKFFNELSHLVFTKPYSTIIYIEGYLGRGNGQTIHLINVKGRIRDRFFSGSGRTRQKEIEETRLHRRCLSALSRSRR